MLYVKTLSIMLAIIIPANLAGLCIASHGGYYELLGLFAMLIGVGYASYVCTIYLDKKRGR